jgi:hypothetical protein
MRKPGYKMFRRIPYARVGQATLGQQAGILEDLEHFRCTNLNNPGTTFFFPLLAKTLLLPPLPKG